MYLTILQTRYLRWCIRLETFQRLNDNCDDCEFSDIFHVFLPFLYLFKPTQDGGRGSWVEGAKP